MPVDRPLLADSQGRLYVDASGRLADADCCCGPECFTGEFTAGPGSHTVIVLDNPFAFHLISGRFFSSALTEFTVGWGPQGGGESIATLDGLTDPGLVAGDSFLYEMDQDVPVLGYLQIDIINTRDGDGGDVTFHYVICFERT